MLILLGLHALTCNDYVSNFFRKGKTTYWKDMKHDKEFVNLFNRIGTDTALNEDQLAELEKYVCCLYARKKLISVNEAIKCVFWDKFLKQ